MSELAHEQALSTDSNRYYLDRQTASESNARTYPRRLPLAIRHARGLYVTDVEGRVYMDCMCAAGTLALGHNHPVVVDAIREHLNAGLPLQTLDITTPVKDEFVHELLATLPEELASNARIQFCSPSGADAVEAALKLVKFATGQRTIIAFSGAYHGQTHGALALTGNPAGKVNGLMPDVHFQPYPYRYRCPMGKIPCNACQCGDHTAHQLCDPESGISAQAGIILEVVQGEGGVVPCDDDWLRTIRGVATEREIPLILDEVQTGWGRTGRMYAFEHAGVVPDVVVLSKAIGGGLPLAVVVYRADLDAWPSGAHAGTFRGNQLAMATGLATLRYIQEHDLCAHAGRMGARFTQRLSGLKLRHSFVGDVRGRGLMLGIEIVNPEIRDRFGRPLGDGERARRIQQECFRRGLLLELGGRNSAVLRLLPPLTITAAEVDAVCQSITDAMDAAFLDRAGEEADLERALA